MKNIRIRIITLLLLVSLSVAQAQDFEYSTLLKNVKMFMKIGHIENAVLNAQKLANLTYSETFSFYIHNELNLSLMKPETETLSIRFIEQLYRLDDRGVSPFVSPIYYYSQIKKTTAADSLTTLLNQYLKEINGKPDYAARRERYTLFIINELKTKKFANNALINALIDKSIASIQKYTKINIQGINNRNDLIERAWCRQVLSIFCYLKYESDPTGQIEMLKLATQYSPDKDDHKVLFYSELDNVSLKRVAGKYTNARFEYAEYLKEKGQKMEALDVIANVAVYNPSSSNYTKLKDAYAEMVGDNNFENYWIAKVESSFDPVPNLSFKTLQKEKFKLAETNDKWVFLDVWGAWCTPCVKSLPEIQKFYAENKDKENSPLSVYTLSYESNNLEYFLSNNNYTFPVAEIDKWQCEQLGVYYYPTKFFITPHGKLIRVNSIHQVNYYIPFQSKKTIALGNAKTPVVN